VSDRAAWRHEQLRREYRQERLERRYRRLLALYPADHRREHAEEMVGVLLAAAADGRRRFDVADAADLLAGAARIRMRIVGSRLRDPRWPASSVCDPRWSDALAAASVVFPLLLVVAALSEMGLPQTWESQLTGQGAVPGALADGYLTMWPLTFGAPLTALLALLRLRRVAACAALVTTVSLIAIAPSVWGTYSDPGLALAVFLSCLTTGALCFSADPARGLTLLRWWGTASVAGGALVMSGLTGGTMWPCCYLAASLPRSMQSAGTSLQAASSTVVTVNTTSATSETFVSASSIGNEIAAMVAIGVVALVTIIFLRGPVGRRVMVLLLVPAIPYVFIVLSNFESLSYAGISGLPSSDAYSVLLLYLLPGLLLVMIVAVARIRRRRARSG